MNDSTSTTTNTTARRLSIAGIVCAVLALVVLPFVLGPVGAVLGFTADRKGDRPLGRYVGIGFIVATIAGIALGVVLWQAGD